MKEYILILIFYIKNSVIIPKKSIFSMKKNKIYHEYLVILSFIYIIKFRNLIKEINQME